MKTPGIHVKSSLVLMLLTVLSLPLAVGQTVSREPSFVRSAYLWTQATDTDLSGNADWNTSKTWLGVARLGADSDPGGWGSWADTTEGWNNNHWGDQQTRYGTRILPDILPDILFWGMAGSFYSKSAAKYRLLFGGARTTSFDHL